MALVANGVRTRTCFIQLMNDTTNPGYTSLNGAEFWAEGLLAYICKRPPSRRNVHLYDRAILQSLDFKNSTVKSICQTILNPKWLYLLQAALSHCHPGVLVQEMSSHWLELGGPLEPG
jgi:hypothetical protein